jgi:hypothetical protein
MTRRWCRTVTGMVGAAFFSSATVHAECNLALPQSVQLRIHRCEPAQAHLDMTTAKRPYSKRELAALHADAASISLIEATPLLGAAQQGAYTATTAAKVSNPTELKPVRQLLVVADRSVAECSASLQGKLLLGSVTRRELFEALTGSGAVDVGEK